MTDGRGGGIGDESGGLLATRLDAMPDPQGVEIEVRHVKQYRACVIFRGDGLEGNVADTDSQQTGVPPLAPVSREAGAERMAQIAADFVERALVELSDQPAANGILLRGFRSEERRVGKECRSRWSPDQ